MRKSRLDFEIVLGLFAILVSLILLCLAFYRPVNKATNIRDVTITVTDKVVKNSGDSGKYLIFGEDMQGNVHTFEITDSWLKFRFNSSDVYASLDEGSTYILTVGGSRNRLLSWYPNIYEYVEIEGF